MLNMKESYFKKAFFIVLGLLVILNIFILPHHPHFSLEKFTGFWAVFGLLVALMLAKTAKGAAHTFLGKDEDFYTKKEKEEPVVFDLHQHQQGHHDEHEDHDKNEHHHH